MKKNWIYEKCKRCGRAQRLAWQVETDLWERVSGKWRNRVLCLECFLELSDERKIKINKSDFSYLAFIANSYDGDTLLERKSNE